MIHFVKDASHLFKNCVSSPTGDFVTSQGLLCLRVPLVTTMGNEPRHQVSQLRSYEMLSAGTEKMLNISVQPVVAARPLAIEEVLERTMLSHIVFAMLCRLAL